MFLVLHTDGDLSEYYPMTNQSAVGSMVFTACRMMFEVITFLQGTTPCCVMLSFVKRVRHLRDLYISEIRVVYLCREYKKQLQEIPSKVVVYQRALTVHILKTPILQHT